jgi:hypothetical protein
MILGVGWSLYMDTLIIVIFFILVGHINFFTKKINNKNTIISLKKSEKNNFHGKVFLKLPRNSFVLSINFLCTVSSLPYPHNIL